MSALPIQMMARKTGPKPRPPQPKKHVTTLRMKVTLHEHLTKCAEANFRSVSAEISARLMDSIQGESFDEHGVIVRSVHSLDK
jgi:hypothetical protein